MPFLGCEGRWLGCADCKLPSLGAESFWSIDIFIFFLVIKVIALVLRGGWLQLGCG